MTTGAVMRRRSLEHVGAFPRLTRLRRQRLLTHAPRPGRCDHAHAEHALGRAEEIDAPCDRPPAVAGLLEERKTLQPLLLPERRSGAVELAAAAPEAEQRQPVLEPKEGDEVA